MLAKRCIARQGYVEASCATFGEHLTRSRWSTMAPSMVTTSDRGAKSMVKPNHMTTMEVKMTAKIT